MPVEKTWQSIGAKASVHPTQCQTECITSVWFTDSNEEFNVLTEMDFSALSKDASRTAPGVAGALDAIANCLQAAAKPEYCL